MWWLDLTGKYGDSDPCIMQYPWIDSTYLNVSCTWVGRTYLAKPPRATAMGINLIVQHKELPQGNAFFKIMRTDSVKRVLGSEIFFFPKAILSPDFPKV